MTSSWVVEMSVITDKNIPSQNHRHSADQTSWSNVQFSYLCRSFYSIWHSLAQQDNHHYNHWKNHNKWELQTTSPCGQETAHGRPTVRFTYKEGYHGWTQIHYSTTPTENSHGGGALFHHPYKKDSDRRGVQVRERIQRNQPILNFWIRRSVQCFTECWK